MESYNEYHMPVEEMYSITIQNLKDKCAALNTRKDMSMAEFCRLYNIDRTNLVQVLNLHQEISVGLFMKISAILSDKPIEVIPGTERLSLLTYMKINYFAVQSAMYNVNFRA